VHVAVTPIDATREVERQAIADKRQIVGIEPFKVAAATQDARTGKLLSAYSGNVNVWIMTARIQTVSNHAKPINGLEYTRPPAVPLVIDYQGAGSRVSLAF
jgi:hypothetical protein